jgi:hypothetical protein
MTMFLLMMMTRTMLACCRTTIERWRIRVTVGTTLPLPVAFLLHRRHQREMTSNNYYASRGFFAATTACLLSFLLLTIEACFLVLRQIRFGKSVMVYILNTYFSIILRYSLPVLTLTRILLSTHVMYMAITIRPYES